MRWSAGFGLALLACGGAVPLSVRPDPGNVIVLGMITTPDGASGRFQPAKVRVKQGDTLRFVIDGRTLHNVSFPPSENPGRSNLPPPGPYLTAPGQTYDLVVAMAPGTYHFQCDPHAPLGMTGVLTVVAGERGKAVPVDSAGAS